MTRTLLTSSLSAIAVAALAISLLGCTPEEKDPVCVQDGVTYDVGQSMPSSDCNACSCGPDGLAQCTAMGCPECGPDDCPPMGALSQCSDGSEAGPGACEMQENGECGWAPPDCPEDLCGDMACPGTAPYCEGDIANNGTYSECNPATGECVPAPGLPPENCAESGMTCVDGVCVDATPCAGLSCGDTCDPPDTECAEAYCDADLSCVCAAPEDIICAEDLCADVACPSTPSYCEGDVAYSGSYSECNPATGECLEAPGQPPEDCAELGLTCVDGSCQGVECSEDEVWDEEVGACCPTALFIADCFCPDGDVIETEVYDEKGCLLGWDCKCADAGACTFNGASYAAGESFDAGDGCNTCTCFEDGSVACTEIWCGDGACAWDKDCGPGQFCDFPGDDCGAWGGTGTCADAPSICVAGGPGACGCSGSSMTNGCEIQAGGTDVNQYGGCTGFSSGDTFACGGMTCDAATEHCVIQGNDIAGEVAYFSSCSALPEGCGQGDCSCMVTSPWESCYDASGFTMMFYPGG